MGLVFRLAWQTLVARPTLALLAVLLLALSTALLYGLIVSVNVIVSLRGSLLSDLSVEIELSTQGDSLQNSLVDELEARPDVLSVQSLSPREVLEEVERELGESLTNILTDNPFPPILRVKLREPTLESLDTFLTEISDRPGVLQAVYPRDLWLRLEEWIAALRGRIAFVVGAFSLLGWILVGLSLRAILKNRRTAWQLLILLGIQPRDLELTQLLLEICLGVFAGLIAAVVIQGGLILASWFLLGPIETPTNWILISVTISTGLVILAGNRNRM